MLKKLNEFLRDTSGNIIIMSAAAMMPMLIAAGVGLDMAERYRATQSYQHAVDAAALAAAKVLNDTGNSVNAKAFGEDVFEANIKNLPNSEGSINIDTGNGDCSTGVVAVASLRHPMFFDSVHGFFTDQGDADHLNIDVTSEVKCGNDTVEIALVLDNSGSMRNSKIATLRTAATDLVEGLHTAMSNNPKPKAVQFSLVPFSGMVNVGPTNENASWMDTQGRSSIHNEHLNWDTYTGPLGVEGSAVKIGNRYVDETGAPLTRFRLYDELGISWTGCVEERPFPMHTNDETPSVSDGDSLFVPVFAPDTPDNYTNEREKIPVVGGGGSGTGDPNHTSESGARIYCAQWYSGYYWNYCYKWYDEDYPPNNAYYHWYHPTAGLANRFGGEYNVGTGAFLGSGAGYTNGNYINEETYDNNYIDDSHNTPLANPLAHLNPDNSGTGVDQYGRQRWTWKYFNNPSVRWNVVNDLRAGWPGGPNAFCTARPITPLTDSKTDVTNDISQMQAIGSTNIQQGLAWGWRTLSSGEPFTEGRPKNRTDNKKIMIVMTDGNNTYYPADNWSNSVSTRNPAYSAAFGHNGGEYKDAHNGGDVPAVLPKRMFEGFTGIANPAQTAATYTAAMNSHTSLTCNNAKNDGITVYTIAFSVPNGSSVKTILENCASIGQDGNPLYYDAADNAALTAAFKEIEQKITQLTITR